MTAIAFSPNGKHVLSGGDDEALHTTLSQMAALADRLAAVEETQREAATQAAARAAAATAHLLWRAASAPAVCYNMYCSSACPGGSLCY